MHRKQTRYCYWLIWLTLSFYVTTITAQSFEPILVGESLTQEVSVGSADLAQWKSLQQVEIQALERNETVQTYFDTNFNVDGAYGELQSGEILTDWTTVAKKMGTTGFALAGAYALWRRRRLLYLERLRSGDSSAIEELFEEHFASPSTGEGNLKVASVNAVPQGAESWQTWATERGLPAAGATLAALYALWVKRKQQDQPANQYYDEILDTTANAKTRWSTFYRAVAYANQDKQKQEVEIINQQEGLTVDETAQHNTLKIQIQAEQRKLNQLNSYRYYFSEHAETQLKEFQRTGSYYFGSYYNSYSQRLRRAGYYRGLYNLGKDITAQQAVVNSLKTQESPFLKVIAEKNKLISTVSSKYRAILSGAYTHWRTISQRAQETQAWLTNLATLNTQTTRVLAQQKIDQQETFKQNLKTVLSTFSTDDMEALKAGSFSFEEDPRFSMTIAAKEEAINEEIRHLATKAEAEFQRQASNVNTYNHNLYATLQREAEVRYPFGAAVYNTDFEYIKNLRAAYIGDKQRSRALTPPDRSVIQQRYMIDHKAGLEQSLKNYKADKQAYDLKRALSQARDLDLSTPIETLIPPISDPVPVLDQELETLKEQKKQAVARANAVVSNAYNAIQAQFRAQYPNYNYWYIRRYVWPSFYQARIGSYQAHKDRQLQAANKKFDPLISQAYRDISIAKTGYEKEVIIREQKVAALENLRAQAPDANRLLSFIKQLESVAGKSRFFAKKSTQTGDLKVYQEAITSLEETLNSGGTYAKEIAEIKQQLSVKNELTWDDYLDQNPADRAYLAQNPSTAWWSKDNWNRQRYDIGHTYGKTWNKRYAELARSISTNYMGAADNPGLIEKLEQYAVKAHEEMLKSHSGWQRYYKEHPLIADTRRDQLQARLEQLKGAQNKEAAQLTAQIETLQGVQTQTVEQLYATQTWLGSSAEDRAQNRLTDEIIAAEIATEANQEPTPASLLDDLAWERKTQSLQTKIEVGTFTGSAVSWAQISNYDPKKDKQLQAKISRMRWMDTKSGQAHKSNIFNAASKAFHQKRYEAYKTSNGKDLSYGEYIRRATGVNGQSLERETAPSTPTSATINDHGEIDTRDRVELAEQYDGLSSENPESIKQFKQYMAEKSLRESSENPTNIAAAQAAVEAYSATHMPTTTIDPSTAVTQAEALLESTTVEETPNPLPVVPPLAETEKEALREKFLNLEQETAGESEFEKWVGEQVDMTTAFELVANNPIIKQSYDAKTNTTRIEFDGKIVTITPPQLAETTITKSHWWDRAQSWFRKLSNQVTFGDDSPTADATGGWVAEFLAALIGLDLPADIRDLAQSLRDKDLVKGVVATAAMFPLVGALKVFIKKSPSSGVIGKLNDLFDEASRQLKIDFKVNGEYVTPDGFRVKVEDQAGPVQKSGSGVGGSGGGKFIDYQKIDDLIKETINLGNSGNVTSKFMLNSDEVLEAAEKYLGDGYIQDAPSSYRSVDGLRRFRMDKGSLDGLHSPKPGHVHFEIFNSAESLKPVTNNHIIIKE